MSMLLRKLLTKKEVDEAIRTVEDKVLVLRFGQDESSCLHLDNILAKTSPLLTKMAEIYVVNTHDVPVYTQYFDITLTPATIFFFNAQHIKVDYGSPDHTKYIGSFKSKHDFIDLVEVVYRGAMKGKLMVTSPIDPQRIPKYDMTYKDI